jgi:hypothetical protein
MKIRFTLIILFTTITSLFSQTWEQALSKDAITVWTRKVSWSEYKEFKGETTINANLNNILSVFDDLTTYTKWVHNCIEATQIKRESSSRGTRYIAIKSPWPVSNRDVVFEYTVSQNRATKVVNLKLIAVKGVVPDKGRVRMTYMISNYELTPLSKTKTKVIYQSHNDPAGSVPTAIINKTLTDTPYYTLLKLKQVIASGNYKKQIFKEIIEF